MVRDYCQRSGCCSTVTVLRSPGQPTAVRPLNPYVVYAGILVKNSETGEAH